MIDIGQKKDTIEVLESLVANPQRIGTVASARNRTVYRKKLKRRLSPGLSPQMTSKREFKKKEGFFCLLGNNCLKQDLEMDHFMF